jgi:hypothetical protein
MAGWVEIAGADGDHELVQWKGALRAQLGNLPQLPASVSRLAKGQVCQEADWEQEEVH